MAEALIDAAHSLSCQRSLPRWTLSGFADAPRGLLGRLYTAKVAAQVLDESLGRDVVALRMSAERGVRWRPLPQQPPIRDPIGFSYLGESRILCQLIISGAVLMNSLVNRPHRAPK